MALSTKMQSRCAKSSQCAQAACHTVLKKQGTSNLVARKLRKPCVVACASEAPAETAAASPSAPVDASEEWVPVMAPEELPKGVRKEVRVNGCSVLMFWYRNQIFAIDARSPAEGAYSEGFIKAKFTQDYGIECPTTGSVFSLKDGSIIAWYPTNPVLRAVTPQTSGMTVYPVKLTQDAIQIALGSRGRMAMTRGGADTSLENNNVFALQPPVYVAGSDDDAAAGAAKPAVDISTAATFSVAIAAFGIVAVVGTATCLFLDDYLLLGAFWVGMLGLGAYSVYSYEENKAQ